MLVLVELVELALIQEVLVAQRHPRQHSKQYSFQRRIYIRFLG
jgi:hypothetical protein